MAEKPTKAARLVRVMETVAIFAAIASLWPAYILRLEHEAWRWLSYAMLGVMAVVFVRRLLAFNRLARKAREARDRAAREGEEKRARLPWEPPGP